MSALGAALRGRCPACGQGRLYEGFLMLNELCPGCGVRFERYVSTRLLATVLSFAVGAAFAWGVSGVVRQLGGAVGLLVPLAVALAAVSYPVFRNVAVWLLWRNGWVTVDEPEAPRHPEPVLAEGFAPTARPFVALPPEDDPTQPESDALGADEPTDG